MFRPKNRRYRTHDEFEGDKAGQPALSASAAQSRAHGMASENVAGHGPAGQDRR